jgi:hypothetical protein
MKARTGSPWTPSRLASRPSKKQRPKSIVGKSYHNLHEFGKLVRKAAIVSNQHLQAKYPDGTSTSPDAGELRLSGLCPKDHALLVAAIEADFPDGIDDRHADVLVYERIPLDLQSFRQTLLGIVTDFVSAIGPEYAVTAKPLYDALLSEITRCTGTVSNAKTLTELKKQKGLAQTGIAALIDRVQKRARTPVEWWPIVEGELSSVGWKAVPLRRLNLACLSYWRARERGAGPAMDLSAALSSLIDTNPDLLTDSIVDSLAGFDRAARVADPLGEPYTRQAALLVEIMDSLE